MSEASGRKKSTGPIRSNARSTDSSPVNSPAEFAAQDLSASSIAAPLPPGSELRDYQDWHEYERRLDRPLMMKLPEFERNERLRHIIFSRQFNRSTLDRICELATKVREIAESREGMDFLSMRLRTKRAMLYFTQASTRTFLSFKSACEMLGIVCTDIRDPFVSSESKGESPLDSIQMFSSYFDVIIMRAKYPRFAEACAYKMNDLDRTNDVDRVGQKGVPIINGGSGADEHPTQALLDIYTMERVFSFKSKKDSSQSSRFQKLRRKYTSLKTGIEGKSICFCGDIGRGRTVRSLANLLTLYDNIKMYFVFPPNPTMSLSQEHRDSLFELAKERGKHLEIFESHRLQDVIKDIDLLYMTRIQQEHGNNNYRREEIKACQLTTDLVADMKDYAAIMHPFPRNGCDPEIPFEIDEDPRAMYFEQSHNGMWVRAALLCYIFNVEGEIYSEYERRFSRRHNYNENVIK